jgi:nucleotide-binding universal stress UspA family protein
MGPEKESVRTNGASTAKTPVRAGSSESGTTLRLLVGYDGQQGSRDALAFAGAFCEQTEAEMIVASVRPYRPELLGPESFAAATGEDEGWIRRGAGEVLGSIPVSARVIAGGHEATGLKELAEAEGSDMIVLGSTHGGPPSRASPRGVGERVLDGAPCAVAIVPRGPADTGVSIRTIAVGYDGSAASATALHRAVGLAERIGASLLILGAVEVSLGLAGFETRQPKGFQRAQMERHLRHALDSVPPTVSSESRLLLGEPAEQIAEVANEADLVMLGSRGGYGSDHRVVLGSVGAAIVKSAPSPTLITPTDS